MSSTLTVRLDDAVKAKLSALAEETRRTRSFLAAEAIEDFVNREMAIIEGIKRGLADVEAGRTVSHEDAVARMNATIARASLSEPSRRKK